MSVAIWYDVRMPKIENEPQLLEKRKEFMWSLTSQGFNNAQIGRIVGLKRSRANVIMNQCPKNYKPKWIKRE